VLSREYSEAEAERLRECLRALHMNEAMGRQLKHLESEIAARRITLIRTLTALFGWTQRDVADELHVTEQMVSKLLRKKKKKQEEEEEE